MHRSSPQPLPPPPNRVGRRALVTGLALAATLGGAVAPLGAAELAEVVPLVKPSVVAVGTYNALDNPRFSFRGTGFVVGDGRLVATNFHVLPGEEMPAAARLVVTVPGSGAAAPQVRDARVLATAPAHDLALLALDGEPMPALVLDDGALVREGRPVAFTGFPLGAALGLAPVTHRGIVAAVSAVALPPPTSRQLDAKTLARLRQGPFEIYQLDATAYPGNSGSPMYDPASGRVLGVINMVFVKGTKESVLSAPSGISYAIPVQHLRELMQPAR